MITQVKTPDLLTNSLNSFFKEMYGDQFGEFVCGYWGLKGFSPFKFKNSNAAALNYSTPR